MVFRVPFVLNNEYGGDCKPGVPPLTGVGRGRSPLSALARSRGIILAVKPEIVVVAGANMQWDHFVCPSSSQKSESTAYDLILRSGWGLSSPGKRVGRSSTPCRKRSQVCGSESERWPKYMQ